jgi:uroporphyrinogen decarboxylase
MWFHPDTARIMGELLEIPPGCVAEAMGDDVRQAWVSNNHCMEGIVHERDGEGHVDPWGVEWVKEGPFNQIRRSPLEDADEEAVRAYDHPYGEAENLLANMAPLVGPPSPFFVGCDVSPCLFEMVCRVRGMEQTLCDLAARPDLARLQLERAARFALHVSEEACRRFPLDWLWTGDDVAGQLSMMLSPDMWRDLVAPHLKQILAKGKSHGLWVAYHSCGAIGPIIPDLVDMGLDVLNPVQSTCPGMDPCELKRQFGDRLAFMGGVDTQELLPHGGEAEVRRETERLLQNMTDGGGGYILAASHTVPPETPVDSIFAMYDVAGVSRQEILDRAADIRRRESR